MNRALPILSLCLAIIALAFALVPRDPVVVAPPPEPEARRGTDVEAEILRRRVEVLEDDNRALWDRVVLLERNAQSPVVTDGGVVAPSAAVVQEVAQLKRELRSVIAGEVLSDESSRAALKEVIREAEADAQRERFAQRQQREAQRAVEQKAKWKDFVSKARLTYAQEQELNKRLAAEDAARAAIAQAQQTGQFDPEAFRAIRDQRRETDRVMTGMLDESQKAQYQELRRDDRGWGGGGNRGEGGGGRRERNGQ